MCPSFCIYFSKNRGKEESERPKQYLLRVLAYEKRRSGTCRKPFGKMEGSGKEITMPFTNATIIPSAICATNQYLNESVIRN